MSSSTWIKLVIHSGDPQVLQIARQVRLSPQTVVGHAVDWFRWVDQHAAGPHTRVDATGFNRIVGWPPAGVCSQSARVEYAVLELLEAFRSVGWVKLHRDEVVVQKFGRHFGKSAKRRALHAIRVRESRARAPNKRTSVRKSSAQTCALEESRVEESRREEKHPLRSDPVPDQVTKLRSGTGSTSRAGPATGPDLELSSGTGPDRETNGHYRGQEDNRKWTQLVLLDLACALRLTAEQATIQVRSLKATIGRFRDRADRDDVADSVVETAREKASDPDIDSPIRVFQAAMNKRFGILRK